ncbi:MAG: hypothetical protein PHW01_01170 [Patescibacteria group bacterium]|nr:hypothetical protein [Patescibacteria group bacterium]
MIKFDRKLKRVLFSPQEKSFRTKLFIFLTGAITLVLFFFVLQEETTRVSAQALPIAVSMNHIDFGLVFPGESLEKNFIVYLANGQTEKVNYSLIQRRKPLPPESKIEEDPNMPGFYRDLCPFLTKTTKEGEGDLEIAASVTPTTDLTDKWLIDLAVPALEGYVAQEHGDKIVKIAGDYGCDIVIDIESNGNGTDGNGAGGGPEWFWQDMNLAGAMEIATSPIKKVVQAAVKLPAKLPRVGAWGSLIAASMGLIATAAFYRRNKK